MTANEGSMPVRGVDYPGTFQQLTRWFPDDASCVEYLAGLRWPDGFVCPLCGASEHWRTRSGLWMCRSCGRQTSVTAGTIFHRTRTPLTTWFGAIWFVTAQKNGVSAADVGRMLGFGSYETAWAWLHKLRRAMVRPDRELLGGIGSIVEVDESFIGGRSRGPGKDGGGSDKVPVMIAVERIGARRLGRIRCASIPSTAKENLLDFILDNVYAGTTIRTDGAASYRELAHLGYTHKPINLSATIDPAHVDLPGVHRVASLLKRWVAGTLHYSISAKHFDYYLDEFTFRFNRRTATARGLLFYRLLQQALATGPHPLTELINNIPSETDLF
jgi:transposase-like protein